MGTKAFKCDREGCTRAFTRKADLDGHIRSVHDHTRPFACPECDRSFARPELLRVHRRFKHAKAGSSDSASASLHECDQCGRSFRRRSDALRHERSCNQRSKRQRTEAPVHAPVGSPGGGGGVGAPVPLSLGPLGHLAPASSVGQPMIHHMGNMANLQPQRHAMAPLQLQPPLMHLPGPQMTHHPVDLMHHHPHSLHPTAYQSERTHDRTLSTPHPPPPATADARRSLPPSTLLSAVDSSRLVAHNGHYDVLVNGEFVSPIRGHSSSRSVEVEHHSLDDVVDPCQCTLHDADCLPGEDEPPHLHDAGCGHERVMHNDHWDYIVNDHLHHPTDDGNCVIHGHIDFLDRSELERHSVGPPLRDSSMDIWSELLAADDISKLGGTPPSR